MKKTYKNPTLKVVNVKPAQFIAGSIRSVSGLNGVTKSDSEFSGGDADARGSRFSSWEEQDAAVEE